MKWRIVEPERYCEAGDHVGPQQARKSPVCSGYGTPQNKEIVLHMKLGELHDVRPFFVLFKFSIKSATHTGLLRVRESSGI